MKKHHWFYEETQLNGKTFNIFKKGQKDMEAPKIKSEVKRSKTEKNKGALTVFTYMNWKRFGVSVAIDDGIKINLAWFETHIKFAKI